MKAAAIYCRISSDPTGEEAGVDRQRLDCQALAQRKGWPIIETYIDNDLSAYSAKVRPAYQRLLEDMQRRTVDAVIVWHEDRLHRQPRELERFIDVANAAKVQLATVSGELDLGTAEGRLRARMLGSVGAYESEHRAARIRRKHEELAAAGKDHGGGDRPFGFEEDRVTVRTIEAKLIRDAAKRVLAGDSLRGIVREWNAKGIVTSAGGAWYTGALHKVLTSARIAGWREHQGELVAKATWPAIIPRAQSDRLRVMLRDPARRLNRGARRYLLTSFIRCARCGSRLHARPRGDKKRCYVCASGPGFNGCGGIRAIAEPLEEFVTRVVLSELDTPKLAAALAKGARASENDDGAGLAEDQAQLSELARDWAARKISRAEWIAAREVIEARLEVARARLGRARTSALDRYRGRPGALAKAWPDLDIDQRRAVIGALVERVEVGSAVRGHNYFDPGRVAVVWRV
ncbi:MAG: recombinase family protein [Chloroflexota bacterium]|nr:recombinase family protein [Chloroflexota bacterium]